MGASRNATAAVTLIILAIFALVVAGAFISLAWSALDTDEAPTPTTCVYTVDQDNQLICRKGTP